ncbi:MAG: helix-turn-helix transcriptional regulator, partial [Victivallaceae bacterium]
MLIEVPHNHLYTVDREAGKWDFVFMILRGSEALRLGREVIRRNGPVLHYREGARSLVSARNMLKWPESGLDPLEMSVASYRFMLELYDEFARETEPVKAAPGLLAARRRALSDFSRGIRVAELAEIAGMSYAHFIREFTRVYGITPGELLLEMQMEKALNLLRNSTVTVKETAALCGFTSCGSFCRAFRRRHGQSPGGSRERSA